MDVDNDNEMLTVETEDAYAPNKRTFPTAGVAVLKGLLRNGVDLKSIGASKIIAKDGSKNALISFLAPDDYVFDTAGTGIGKVIGHLCSTVYRRGSLLIAPISTSYVECYEMHKPLIANLGWIVNPEDLHSSGKAIAVMWRKDGPFHVCVRGGRNHLRDFTASDRAVHWVEEIKAEAWVHPVKAGDLGIGKRFKYIRRKETENDS